jgi:hypothetical protein
LLLPITTSDVDWEQDRPGYASADEHNNHGHLEKSEEEVGIERLMLECIGVGDLSERFNPIEPSIWQRLCTFSV